MNVVKLGALLINTGMWFAGIHEPGNTSIVDSACIKRRGDQ